MAQPANTEMIRQLEAARKLVLGDADGYNQILPGIIPIIGPNAALDVRRWGADFVAECFASPALPNAQKEELCSDVLPTWKNLLETPGQDVAVLRSAIQAAASLYPLVFRRVMSHPDQALLWQDMNTIKMTILRLMDTAPTSVKICCIKFLQRVVQVQTPGVIADPRRPEQNETSIALVPRNHPLMPLPNMEAEASGLLDRLLSLFQENGDDPILIDATLNCLAVLIRSRPAVANKIISAILNFNPFKQATSTSMTPRLKVVVKSLERSTRAVLKNVLKHNPNSTLAPKIAAHMERLLQSRATIFSETSLKRPAPSEATDGPDDAKRQRLTTPTKFPHMPPPPNSFADLFTLTTDTTLRQFDVKLLPIDMVNTISGVLLQHVNQQALDAAVEAVKARYAHLQKLQQPTPVPLIPMAGPTGIDDPEEDYEPEYELSADAIATPATAQVLEELAQPAIDLGPFELPKPPPLTGAEVSVLSQQTIGRVFEIVTTLDTTGDSVSRQKLGFNRLAAAHHDRDAWVTMMTRLATRAPAALETALDDDIIKSEAYPDNPEAPTLANTIRHTLYMYILDSFRPRLNIAITWLTEEWYADKLSNNPNLPNYNHWTLKLLDSLLAYLDARDAKLLVRFVSEIPAITPAILERVQSLARDPERVSMCLMALQYLILMRPPVREIAIDTVERIWRDDDFMEARPQARKVLAKWRPGVLVEKIVLEPEEVKVNGTGNKSLNINGNGVDESENANGNSPGQHQELGVEVKGESPASALSADPRIKKAVESHALPSHAVVAAGADGGS